MSEVKKPSNEFRIGFKSNPKEIITKCEELLKDDKIKEVHLSAISSSIGEISIISEILKCIFPNLSQKNVFSVISPPSSGKNKKTEENIKKLYPRLEIILTMGEKKEDSPTKISEEHIKLLIDTLEKQKESYRKSRNSKKSFRRNRRWRAYPRKKRYSYSAKRTNFNSKRTGFNNRRQFGKSPIRGRNNANKTFGSRKTSGNKQAASVKN
jgi:hypothetical protein